MNRNGNDVPSSPLYTFYELLLPEFTEINSDGENLKQSELSSSKDEANNEMVTNNNIPHPIFHRLVFNSRNEIISTIDDYFSQFDINNQDLAQHNSIFTKSKFVNIRQDDWNLNGITIYKFTSRLPYFFLYNI
ncbi:uncharacterized protein OCT59_025577 [Rhizophagus irregularis]|uniref:Uncharacterized protein n=1 Tax=Rhizophagus irregularis (strain DAOM 181602 / DAOM 197198 / MUCL 43194) TaxID=747089 RepID=U9UPY2_RHIID|nr:hypothetical protein OCT59_025577 [Rhizophagus irregularis]GBC11293.1 hypothetical protein GLOIN_2v1761764 [Rhizophagus irregularis DAOM 181602=DAOM 197198]CAG8448402.1 13093_t:CDS:2 [Rhizophagus irregularis]